MLGLLTDIDKNFWIEVQKTFTTRNAIVHGKQSLVSREDAESAIEVARKLVEEHLFPDGPSVTATRPSIRGPGS